MSSDQAGFAPLPFVSVALKRLQQHRRRPIRHEAGCGPYIAEQGVDFLGCNAERIRFDAMLVQHAGMRDLSDFRPHKRHGQLRPDGGIGGSAGRGLNTARQVDRKHDAALSAQLIGFRYRVGTDGRHAAICQKPAAEQRVHDQGGAIGGPGHKHVWAFDPDAGRFGGGAIQRRFLRQLPFNGEIDNGQRISAGGQHPGCDPAVTAVLTGAGKDDDGISLRQNALRPAGRNEAGLFHQLQEGHGTVSRDTKIDALRLSGRKQARDGVQVAPGRVTCIGKLVHA